MNGDSLVGETGQFYTATESGFYSVTVGDAFGCTASSSTVSVILGIDESLFKGDVNIYPNPSTGEFIVEINNTVPISAGVIRILNMVGQIIFSEKLDMSHGLQMSIDLRAYPAGLYNLQLMSKAGVVTKKLML